MTELPKTFDPAAIEARWYAHWEAEGLFHPDRPGAEPFTLVNPPPNVTGSLHIGHALDNTLQDILVRHARLQGKDARWVVGTDHAGIATQMVVERNLASQGVKRTDLGRDAFTAKVWEWKAESGGAITGQLRRLGCSMDWANERFTMDEGFSKAVLKVFVALYRQGLLYRDKRLVNWDPGLGTAISDLEVETREVQGGFWTLRYPLEDGSGHVEVATTRPETMLADMMVAVHPDDARYAALVGRMLRLPITGRLVPIVADVHADPELGSGAVKITPGHDFNDFEVARRQGVEARDMLNLLDARAAVCQTADGLVPSELIGLDRFEARKRIVALLETEGALVKVEDRVIQAPYGDRSGVVIEPWLTDQWYVDAKTLAKGPIEAVRDGRIQVVPKSWEKTFFNWMENIQPWCVSRQLWWGHRIPAWYGPVVDEPVGVTENGRVVWKSERRAQSYENEVFVAQDETSAIAMAASLYGVELSEIAVFNTAQEAFIGQIAGAAKRVLWRDEDVLDTWFSSALWPFATLGWPDKDATQSPFVPSEVEGRAASDALGVSTSLDTNGREDGAGSDLPYPPFASSEVEKPVPDQRVSTSLDMNGEGEAPRPTLHGRYPNDILISGFDILFFWDARMMMQGMHFLGDVPFRKLYLHGLVRAADGQKMSKSKGNTVDPLGLIDRYGADALRFFMAAMESQGRDIKMDEKRVEGYRNFATKLWNAVRFAMANGIGASNGLEPPTATLAVNRWIVAETVATVQALDLALADLRFDGAANTIYQFVWSRFCDWYLELIKPVLSKVEGPVLSPVPGERGEGAEADETRAVAGWVLDQILVMLHPFMPFITEELWHALGERECDLIVAKWPMPDARALDAEAVREIDWLIGLISEVRSVRTELNIPPGTKITLMAQDASDVVRERLNGHAATIERLGRFVTGEGGLPRSAPVVVYEDSTFLLPLDGVIDLDAERARLGKAIAAAEKERDGLAGRLSNPSFVERAKPEAVEKARADHAEKAAEAERLGAALARLE